MPRRIILHIGMPKCGSTFLQVALRRNRRRLASVGAVYPHKLFGHPGNAADLASITLPRLERMFGRAETLILSHEDLFGQAKRGVALMDLAAAQGIEVQVLTFLRPLSEFLFGSYSQTMKQHSRNYLAARRAYDGLSFEEFATVRAPRIAPVRSLALWARLVPDRPLILAPHHAIAATVDGLLGTSLNWAVPRHRTNPSLRVSDCEAIALAMADPAVSPWRIRCMLGDAGRAANAGRDDPGRTPERIDMLEAMFAEQNALLLRRFGYDNRILPR